MGGVTNSTSDLYDDDDYDDDDYEKADYDNDNDSVQHATSPMGSVVWSSSGAGMPEIVELNVSVKLDADDLLAMSPVNKLVTHPKFL